MKFVESLKILKWLPNNRKVHHGNFLFWLHIHMNTHYKYKYALLRLTQTESASWSREQNEYALISEYALQWFFMRSLKTDPHYWTLTLRTETEINSAPIISPDVYFYHFDISLIKIYSQRPHLAVSLLFTRFIESFFFFLEYSKKSQIQSKIWICLVIN